MARIKKKGTTGNAKNYITRSQAVRKLQISLPDFRRLCIFKGIYPREPRSKKKVSKSSTPSTTFYYAKDIQYLLHEPLLEKFRDQKALAKKISRALGRNEVSDASRLARNHSPKARLDHIIKERYPTFSDALRDLDDALSMLFLFANLPSTDHVPAKIVAKCQRLTLEFEHYLIKTHSIRKSFLSIKGIYYQATVQGQDILWLVPYRFVQRFGDDVDFRIMATFVEFYTTLLGFVNFRLYTSMGLVYPPQLDSRSEEQGAELGALRIQGATEHEAQSANPLVESEAAADSRAQIEADKLLLFGDTINHDTETKGNDHATIANSLDKFSSIDPTADLLFQPSAAADSEVASRLFDSCTIFLSRETPRHPLEFLLKAFGCVRVGWDSSLGEPGAYCAESDARITHQIVDRPDVVLATADGGSDASSNTRVPGRIYIQPQWVWDSLNAGRLQRTDLYAPGATLPPHLSPWMKPRKGEYDPTRPLAEQESVDGGEEAAEASDDSDTDSQDGRPDQSSVDLPGKPNADEELGSDEDDGMHVALADSDEESDINSERQGEVTDDWAGLSDTEHDSDEDADTRASKIHQAELEAEARGLTISHNADEIRRTAHLAAKNKRVRADLAVKEEVERRKMMMPRRKRKMYEKMVYSNARRDEESEKLRKKRRKIERQTKDHAS